VERGKGNSTRKPAWRRDKRSPAARAPSSGDDSATTSLIYGLHAAAEALRNPKREIIRVLATENALRRLGEATKLSVEPQIVDPREIDRLLPPDAVHQGLLVEAEPLIAPELDEIEADGIVLALDQITDPHNVGAILRSAAAFAVKAVILPQRHSPSATGVLAKAASGALEHVPLVPVRNLSDALIALGERGFQRIGLDSEGEGTLEEARLASPLLLALGAEGKGLRERVRSCCDLVLRIDLPGAIKSLNVSNAAAIALSLAHRKLASLS
jgi:23S rRNA (guanosine2251-2'-O)-methyltransferase